MVVAGIEIPRGSWVSVDIEHDLACLPGPRRGAIYQDSAAQQHGGKLRIPRGSFCASAW
jgi:hypothetical protein